MTGAAALYAASHAGASGPTIENAILGSAVPTASPAGRTVTGGRLNASGSSPEPGRVVLPVPRARLRP